MESSESPVEATLSAPDPGPTLTSRVRWAVHLIILALYPLSLGILSLFLPRVEGSPAIPRDPVSLITTVLVQLALFFLLFGIAWACSRATVNQLMLPWKGGLHPLWRGLVYSIGLRVFLAVLAVVFVIFALLCLGWNDETVTRMIPRIDKVVDTKAVATDPVYLLLNATLVSFVFAGFREELWRAGMLAALVALFPRAASTLRGKFLVVAVVAIIFGLGHLPQGWAAVVLTTLLGAGLGAIILFHGTIWDAVLAHGFFDATTFLLIYALQAVPQILEKIPGIK